MNYVAYPNLPAGEVAAAAVSAGSKAAEALEAMGVAVVPVGICKSLPGPTAAHADLQLLHLGGERVLCAECSEDCAAMLKALGFSAEFSQKALGADYPDDCALNALILDNKVFANEKAVDPVIVSYAGASGREVVQVKQGYARCSCAVVAKRAFITADGGIAQEAVSRGFDVLTITPGDIELPGYDCGFIGGCCGLLAPDLLVFSGDIHKHRDSNEIKAFARNYGVYIEPLSKGPLVDIGGILPLAER